MKSQKKGNRAYHIVDSDLRPTMTMTYSSRHLLLNLLALWFLWVLIFPEVHFLLVVYMTETGLKPDHFGEEREFL